MKSLLLLTTMVVASPALRADAAQPQPLPRPWFAYHHASTALEGALRGCADYVSAHGEFFVNRAYAEFVAQQARQLAIQVEQERIRAHWRIRDDYNRRTYDDRVSAEKIAKIIEARRPERLSPHALGPAKTTIHWPAVFRGEVYDNEREAMELALAQRASGQYGVNSNSRSEAVAIRDQMLAKLKQRIVELPPMQYMAAKRFVEALAHETLFPAAEEIADQ